MKKLALVLMVAVVVLVIGATEQVLRTDRFIWQTRGEAAGSDGTTAYTSPAVNERDYDNLVANHANALTFTVTPYRWNAVGFRFVVDDDGDAWVADVFVSKGQDFFTRIVTLTITGGTQIGPPTSTDTASGVFCDTIAASNEFWITEMNIVDGGGTDRIATIWFDLAGFDTISFIPTTIENNEVLLVQNTGY